MLYCVVCNSICVRNMVFIMYICILLGVYIVCTCMYTLYVMHSVWHVCVYCKYVRIMLISHIYYTIYPTIYTIGAAVDKIAAENTVAVLKGSGGRL